MQNAYELMLILLTSLTEKEEKKILEEVKKYLKDEGKIKETTHFGKRKLAYPIKKENDGNYWLLNLAVDGKEASDLSQKLKAEEKILRYLLLRKDK